MHRSQLRSRPILLAALCLLTLAALLSWGCSTRPGAGLTAPDAPQPLPRTGLSVQNPAHVAMVMQLQDENTEQLMSIPGVVGTGTGASWNGAPAIVVYTSKAIVGGVPTSIKGVPVDLRYVGDVRAYEDDDAVVSKGGGVAPYVGGGGTVAAAAATLQMGTSTGNDKECASGTLGCVVLKGGVKYFLSNNHVFARQNAAAKGERIDAPGRYDARPQCAQTPQIATLTDFQAISFSSNNTIDAAIAQPISGLAYTCAEAGGYTPSSTVVAPSVGLAVKKTGRTSGLTTGSIQAINVTIRVGYTGGTATFVGQIQTPGKFIRSGDSGSLMVTQSGNNPVGLCFAGSSQASFSNVISNVLSRFSATVCNQ
ncbi:MAG: hypothetical protein HZB25_09935 [Candidatus Eisenbacteria bacterium]|nr:hypothetical protein [Candidatus Eisenbacteria bacterium]